MRALLTIACLLTTFCSLTAAPSLADAPNPRATAAQIDRLLAADYQQRGVTPVAPCSDADFLRRAAFDLAGRPPKPDGVLKFVANSQADKRAAAVDLYLSGDDWATNRAAYWRDAIFSRATNARAKKTGDIFATWMAGRLADGAGWNTIVSEMLTATGDVRVNGATGLLFAHDAKAEEVAGEVSRLFLGIQIGCAECHDHPDDVWTRNDFHTLAAFFPRVRVRVIPYAFPPTAEIVSFDLTDSIAASVYRQDPAKLIPFLDKNGDGKLSRDEAVGTRIERNFGLILAFGDKDKDGMISAEEAKLLPRPDEDRTRTEHYQPDPADPSSRGAVIRPQFFLDGAGARLGTNDLTRRRLAAAALTDHSNVWFARAMVNRVWAELVGSGFYARIDDLGPGRTAVCPDVLNLLCDGFVASDYDLKWLLATVANTDAYARSLGDGSTATDAPFAAAQPRRLRADQVYAALRQVLGEGPSRGFFGQRNDSAIRQKVTDVFGYDPSTPPADVTGDMPQALFLMNGSALQGRIAATGSGPLASIIAAPENDAETVEWLYLFALSRTPTPHETEVCLDHLATSRSRLDAYEDLLWALMNSAEFVTRR